MANSQDTPPSRLTCGTIVGGRDCDRRPLGLHVGGFFGLVLGRMEALQLEQLTPRVVGRIHRDASHRLR